MQVSKHIQLAQFFLLALQGAAMGSQEQARELRKALLFLVAGSPQRFITAWAPVSSGSETKLTVLEEVHLKKKQDKQTSQSTDPHRSLTSLLEKFLFLRDLFHFKSHTGQDYGKIYHLFQ